MEKSVQELKEKIKKEKIKERKINRKQIQNTKVRFPTHTTNFLHFKSNNFNLFASKLPKAALCQ